MNKNIIESIEVFDIRVPTSDSGLGSDPFHKDPDYSAVYTVIKSSSNFKGVSIVFTCGMGNDWIVYGVKQIAKILINSSFDNFINNPGQLYKELLDHSQLRWLGDGIYRMALGAIVNAFWDLWAKHENLPIWELLLNLDESKIVKSIDWRYLKDVLEPDECIELLKSNRLILQKKKSELLSNGLKSYLTVGWTNLSDKIIIDKVKNFYNNGFRAFKIKVGSNLNTDIERLKLIRKEFGPDIILMVDSNQIWGVNEAVNYMENLKDFNIKWIEEPTARDDIIGHKVISSKLKKYHIGVAAGEQVQSPIIFKQMLSSGALQYCQIDATRMGGVNEILAVILMANKFNIPVCPHGGGIGLCNMVLHFSIWDQILVSAKSDNQVIEYLEFLQEDVFINPIKVKDGNYVLPKVPGWGIEMKDNFIQDHLYPHGNIWKDRKNN